MLTPFYKISDENIRNFIKHGVRVLVSTDAGMEHPVRLTESPTLAADTVDPRVKLGEGHFNALFALEELGMARWRSSSRRRATSRTRTRCRDLGSLEVGKIGDLVILDADPLQSARNYRRINSVIKDGKVVDLGALPTAPVISAKTKS